MQKTGLALAGTAETETEELKSGFHPIHLELFSPVPWTWHHSSSRRAGQPSPGGEGKQDSPFAGTESPPLPLPLLPSFTEGRLQLHWWREKSFWLFYRVLDHDVRPAPPHAKALSLFWSLDPPLGFYLSAGVWVLWRTTRVLWLSQTCEREWPERWASL